MKDVPAFFDGVEPEELNSLLGALPRRRFPVGSVLIAEGDSPRETPGVVAIAPET